MKNKKFLKALASFVLGGAAAVGCFAMFGCAHSHTYSEDWKNDAEKHWHEATCEHTGEKSGEAVHEFDADGKCVVCDYQKPQEHKHTWATAWSSNESEHWKECTDPACNEVSEKGPHTVQYGKCIVCGKETGNGEQPVTKYSVTFNVHGHGTAPENLTEVTALPELSTLTEEGWIFGGWYYDDGFLNQANAGDALTANVTLHAKWTKDEQGGEDNPTQYTVTFDVQGHGTAPAAQTVTAGGHATVPTVPTEEGWTFVGWYKEAACTNVFNFETETITAATTVYAKWTEDEQGGEVDPPATQYTVTFDMHGIGTAPATQTVDKDGYATMPAAPSATGYYFVGWYTDDTYATGFDFENTAITADTTVYACWSEDIKSTVTIPTVTSNTAIDGSETIGKVTFVSGRWEANNLHNTGGGSGYIEFNLTGSVNSVSFSSRGASSAEVTIKFVKVENGTETDIKVFAPVKNNVYLPDSDATTPLTIGELPAGVYRLKGTGSFRTANVSLTERLVVSEADSIRVTPATVDFVIGSEFTSEGLATVLHYKNGREDVITGVTVDSSAYKKDVSGKYPVTVSYTVEGSTTPFTATYHVYVYQVDSISLKTNATQQGANTPAGNGTYINHAAQQVYFIGNELNLDGYTVHLNASVTAEGEEKKEKLFRYTPVASDFEGFDTASAGAKTVTLNAYGYTDEFEVLVMAEPVINENAIQILVSKKVGDPEASANLKELLKADELNVGSYIDYNGGIFTFNTIQQALDFLKLANLDAHVQKFIILDAGVYREKLEINIPNLTIVGENFDKNGQSVPEGYSTREDVIIEWDSLYGVADESGYVQTTDSTATLNVRAEATGFCISGITISNYWNSEEKFYEAFGPGYGEHRALAMLVQADKVLIQDCNLLGYQDTIELFTGRQIIRNSYISGTTDFIFGTNNTTYFENCEIHSIARWKKNLDNEGKPVFETDGGYITAFKGNNKNASDYVVYGAIFDKCTFTADEGVAAGNTAIARPWGAYAAVAVINSELGGHISKAGYTQDVTKNQRYVKMGSNNPTDSTVKFVEYNNTGDGAITEAVAGMRFLTAEEAAKYSDLSVIFGKTNGGVTYEDLWSGSLSKVTVTITLGEKSETVYGYHGGTLSQAAINAAVAKLLDSGYELDVITYGDNVAFTAETVLNNDILSAQNTLAVTATQKIAVGKKYTYAYGGTNDAAWVEDTKNGTIKSSDATPVTGIKLIPDTYLTLKANGNKATVKLAGFTTGSSNAVEYFKVEFLNDAGTVVGTLKGTTPTGKCNGEITFTNNVVTTTEAFSSIRITSTTAGKSIAVTSAEISVEFA